MVAMARLNERKQGKRRLDADRLAAAAGAVVDKHRVEGLLDWQVRTSVRERTLRRYGSRPEQVVLEQEHRLEWARQEAAVAQAQRELGWQAYASNHLGRGLATVVWGYRGQYRIEKEWSRLKGRPLSLTPLYLQEEGRVQGLVLLLSLALRLLTLLEGVVWRKLQAGGEKLQGLYPGQPGRQTGRPSAELLLGALAGLSLVVEEVGGGLRKRLTPLSPLQQRLLELWDLPPDLYQRLTLHSPNSLPP